MIPTFILQMWLLGLFSVGLVGGFAYLAYEWQQRSWGWDAVRLESVFAPRWGANEDTMLLVGAVLLLILVLAGGSMTKLLLKLLTRSKTGSDVDPRVPVAPSSVKRIQRPDGSELEVQFFGAEQGIPIVLTHGWGLHSAEWNYLKHELTDRFRLVVWDEPGLGKSKQPRTRDFSVEKFARDLDMVLTAAGGKPAILLGHSIGGMIILTFCRLFPQALGTRVNGLILTHTTYTNPVRTTSGAAFLSVIEKPVLVPLMYLTMALSPVLWVMNWLSYLNGSAHLSNKRSSFGGTETWEQIDFATKFQPQASPAVLARGMLGMMQYDATATLAGITVPVLVVAGDLDSTTKLVASEHMRTAIPRARLLTLTPAKHLGLIEHHGQYATAVREFAHAAQVIARVS